MLPCYTLGNTEFLKLHKTTFLCSPKCPAEIVLKSYDQAIAQREKGDCIVSGKIIIRGVREALEEAKNKIQLSHMI